MKKSLTLIPAGAALAAAIVAGTSFAAAPTGVTAGQPPAALADGSDLPPPPPGAPDFDHHGHGPRFGGHGFDGFGGPGFFGGRGGEHGGVLRDVRQLDLSDAQEDAIDDIFVKHHKEQRELFKRGRDLHRAYGALDPLAKDYVSQNGKLADQAANLMRDALKLRAKIDSEVLATLTPAQAQQLQAELAEKKARREERRARHEHGPRGPQPPDQK